MVRRPLVATVVTTAVGALLGALLGALVGRVIALFGDETVQTSVPMVFCGTLGFFVGGASAAKGSLDRFGAKRSGLGAFVAIVLLVVIVGGASLSHQPAFILVFLAVVGAVVAGVGATLVSGPQPAPVARGGLPPRVTPPKEAEAPRQEQIEAEFIATPTPTPTPVVSRPPIRKVPVIEPEPEPEPDPEPAAPARPPRDRPLSRADVAPQPAKETAKATKKAPAKAKAPEITPPPAPRQRRDRPLRKGDS